MKLNFDYYDECNDNKMVEEEYKEILEIINNSSNENYSEIMNENENIKNILYLSKIRENILNWYDFRKNATILELNANYGELTGLLCENAKKVVSIESSKKKAELLEKRYEKKENLEVIVANYNIVEFDEKFDYIVIIGIIDKLEQQIEYAKKYIKEDGKILLAVNNKYGLNALITTNKEENIINNSKNAISREKLNCFLNGLNYRYYYPLPNYCMPNIIYTENSLPNLENINRDLVFKDESVSFKEVDGYKAIIEYEPKQFINFANSFLVEISKSELEKNNIMFISFSNIRKDEYRVKTVVKNDFVYKSAVNSSSRKHIENVKNNIDIMNDIGILNLDKYENEKIISTFCKEEKLEDKLIKIYKNEGIDRLIEEIFLYKKYIENRLIKIEKNSNIENNIFKKYEIECNEELMKKMIFVRHGFWDLIFQNCFIIDGQYYFFDQEWYESIIPVEYIIYRAIKYFNSIRQYEIYDILLEKLELVDFIQVFDQLDNKIQEKIRKPFIWNIHIKEKTVEKIFEEINHKDEKIKELMNQNKKNNELMEQIQNSTSWKITKPLRKINEIMRRKK